MGVYITVPNADFSNIASRTYKTEKIELLEEDCIPQSFLQKEISGVNGVISFFTYKSLETLQSYPAFNRVSSFKKSSTQPSEKSFKPDVYVVQIPSGATAIGGLAQCIFGPATSTYYAYTCMGVFADDDYMRGFSIVENDPDSGHWGLWQGYIITDDKASDISKEELDKEGYAYERYIMDSSYISQKKQIFTKKFKHLKYTGIYNTGIYTGNMNIGVFEFVETIPSSAKYYIFEVFKPASKAFDNNSNTPNGDGHTLDIGFTESHRYWIFE